MSSRFRLSGARKSAGTRTSAPEPRARPTAVEPLSQAKKTHRPIGAPSDIGSGCVEILGGKTGSVTQANTERHDTSRHTPHIDRCSRYICDDESRSCGLAGLHDSIIHHAHCHPTKRPQGGSGRRSYARAGQPASAGIHPEGHPHSVAPRHPVSATTTWRWTFQRWEGTRNAGMLGKLKLRLG
jgi:hypothetical protein